MFCAGILKSCRQHIDQVLQCNANVKAEQLVSSFYHFTFPLDSTSIYHKWFHSLHSFSSSALCIEVVHFVYLFQCLVCSPSSVFPMRNVLVILTPQTVSRKSRNQDPVIDKGTYTFYVITFGAFLDPSPPSLRQCLKICNFFFLEGLPKLS